MEWKLRQQSLLKIVYNLAPFNKLFRSYVINLKLCYNSYGNPYDVLSLETESLGELKRNEVIVEMIEAPINPSDLVPISGAYKHRIELPLVAGYEGVDPPPIPPDSKIRIVVSAGTDTVLSLLAALSL